MISLFLIVHCTDEKPIEGLQFAKIEVSGNATNWWARTFADINGDGKMDIALQDNNAYGGRLVWLENSDSCCWKTHLISGSVKIGATFAAGDLDAADVDDDGDMDFMRLP